MKFLQKWFGIAKEDESDADETERYSVRVEIQREQALTNVDKHAGYDPYDTGRFQSTKG